MRKFSYICRDFLIYNMTEEIEKILKLFNDKPFLVRMGAKIIAKRNHLNINDVLSARKEYWNRQGKKERTKIVFSTNEVINKLPKILIIDIETAPLRAYVWSRWKQNVYLDQTISEWFMLTWSAKWLFSDKVISARLTSEEALKENDKRITKELWELVNEADILVAHNGNSFDIPKINTRFLLNGLPPTKPFQSIDTKVIAAKQFGFSSNKLDALARYFGFKVKLDTDFELWDKCLRGDETSLMYMEEYNQHDVVLLEEVYLKLRPWIKNHPNMGLYLEADTPVCGNCGSSELKEDGEYFTQVGRYRVYRCACGALSRVRVSNVPKNKRNVLLTNLK